MWQRSIATAFASLALLETNPQWRDSAFLLGLVHDVGRIVLLATAAVPLARRGKIYPDEVIEEVGGAIRCELGAIALAAWIFEDEMVDAVTWQERPDLCPEPPPEQVAWIATLSPLLPDTGKSVASRADSHDVCCRR